MKILRHGNKHTKETYTLTCRECDSKILFEAKDGELVHDARDGDYLQFACPVCSNKTLMTVTPKGYRRLNE